MRITKNHPASIEFNLLSGRLIQNFGVIELTSYRWIELLSGSAIAMEISKELPLARRIDIIFTLLNRDSKLPWHEKEKARKLWKAVKDKGCELRNTIAHGTVGLLLSGNDGAGMPQSIGILKVRKWQDSDQLVSIEELKAAVNKTADIAEKLNALLKDA